MAEPGGSDYRVGEEGMNFVDDMIIKLYELNEHYHDTKEKMAWLASSLYAAFSVTIITWLFNKEICEIQSLPFLIIEIGAFICALWFIIFQYKKKKISVLITGEYEKIILNKNLDDDKKLNRMLHSKTDAHNHWKNYKNRYKKKALRSTEPPIFILISIFLHKLFYILINYLI